MTTPTNPNAGIQGQLFPDDPFGGIRNPVNNQAPAPQVVSRFHTRADTDSSSTSAHHTLGVTHNQASPGDHKHNGQNSKLLMDGVSITGSRGGNDALANLLNALAIALGFTNNTSL